MRHLQTTDLSILDDDTPRIRDLRLGEILGFDRPRKIREIITRNIAEIESYGAAPRRGALIEAGNGAQQKVAEFWLSEEQALIVTMFSRTSRAMDARKEIIRVFIAYRRQAIERPVKVSAHRRSLPNPTPRQAPAVSPMAGWDWQLRQRPGDGLCDLRFVVPIGVATALSELYFDARKPRERLLKLA